jgi:hypothetical protein
MIDPEEPDTEVELPITDERRVLEEVEEELPVIDEPPLEADPADFVEQRLPVPEPPDDYL